MKRLLALFAVAALFAACGDEHDDHSHSGLSPDCQAIVDACHMKDDGTDPAISACHTGAHDNKTSECTANKTQCVAACEAAPELDDGQGGMAGMAGTGGAAGMQDGGGAD